MLDEERLKIGNHFETHTFTMYSLLLLIGVQLLFRHYHVYISQSCHQWTIVSYVRRPAVLLCKY